MSTLSEDFAEFFPGLKILFVRADESADILGSGNVRAADGQMDREDALGAATMQEFNRPQKPAIWICWENQIYLLPGGNHPNKPELSVWGYKSE